MKHLRPFLALAAILTLAGCDYLATGLDSGSGATSITVVNNSVSRNAIGWVYIADCSASSWGPDQLGSEVITPDRSKSWGVEPGCYDVRVEMLDDDRTAAEARVNVAAGEDRRVSVNL